MTTQLEPLFEQLAANDIEIIRYYRVFTILLVAGLLLHLLYASYFVWTIDPVSESQVLLFAIFNVSALVVEIFRGHVQSGQGVGMVGSEEAGAGDHGAELHPREVAEGPVRQQVAVASARRSVRLGGVVARAGVCGESGVPETIPVAIGAGVFRVRNAGKHR